jgi:hypothetical protein
VKYNITYTSKVPSILQRIRCSLIVYLGGASDLISIYSLYSLIEFAGIFRKCDNITQQDAPHKDKITSATAEKGFLFIYIKFYSYQVPII